MVQYSERCNWWLCFGQWKIVDKLGFRKKKSLVIEVPFNWYNPFGNQCSRPDIANDFRHQFVFHLTQISTVCLVGIRTITSEKELTKFQCSKLSLPTGSVSPKQEKCFVNEKQQVLFFLLIIRLSDLSSKNGRHFWASGCTKDRSQNGWQIKGYAEVEWKYFLLKGYSE